MKTAAARSRVTAGAAYSPCPPPPRPFQPITQQLKNRHLGNNVVGRLSVDAAAHGHGRAEHLLAGAGQLARAAARPHDARNLNDVVERNVPCVLHVLLLQVVEVVMGAGDVGDKAEVVMLTGAVRGL